MEMILSKHSSNLAAPSVTCNLRNGGVAHSSPLLA